MGSAGRRADPVDPSAEPAPHFTLVCSTFAGWLVRRDGQRHFRAIKAAAGPLPLILKATPAWRQGVLHDQALPWAHPARAARRCSTRRGAADVELAHLPAVPADGRVDDHGLRQVDAVLDSGDGGAGLHGHRLHRRRGGHRASAPGPAPFEVTQLSSGSRYGATPCPRPGAGPRPARSLLPDAVRWYPVPFGRLGRRSRAGPRARRGSTPAGG